MIHIEELDVRENGMKTTLIATFLWALSTQAYADIIEPPYPAQDEASQVAGDTSEAAFSSVGTDSAGSTGVVEQDVFFNAIETAEEPFSDPWWGLPEGICACFKNASFMPVFMVFNISTAAVFAAETFPPVENVGFQPVTYTANLPSALLSPDSAVPEPSGLALMGFGLVALRLSRRR